MSDDENLVSLAHDQDDGQQAEVALIRDDEPPYM
jgi:hypothetical protein